MISLKIDHIELKFLIQTYPVKSIKFADLFGFAAVPYFHQTFFEGTNCVEVAPNFSRIFAPGQIYQIMSRLGFFTL